MNAPDRDILLAIANLNPAGFRCFHESDRDADNRLSQWTGEVVPEAPTCTDPTWMARRRGQQSGPAFPPAGIL